MQVEIAKDVAELEPLALIDREGGVWIALKLRWWDLATIVWWWFCPADRRAWVTLNTSSGEKVRTRAVYVARKHLRVQQLHRVKS